MQGKLIWILGFFSFLAGLSAVNAIFLSVDQGIDGTFQPFLIGGLTGAIPVYVYLLVSIIATLILLYFTTGEVMKEFSNRSLLNEINEKVNNLENGQKVQQSVLESLKARVFLVDESLNAAKQDIAKRFNEQEKELKQVQVHLTNKFSSELAAVKKGVEKQLEEGFSEQAEMLRQFHSSIVNRFDTKLAEVDNEMTKKLAKMDKTTHGYAQRIRKSTETIMKQRDDIADINLKIAKLEDELAKPEPQLTSQSDTEEVRGIGPNTKDELREMGITNVEELILADPKVIAEQTSISEKNAEKLQGVAQLSMVPSVGERALVLLEEVGITNRKELANQDPLELSRKINGVFQVCVEKGRIPETEKPSIEEIYTWVKLAKT